MGISPIDCYKLRVIHRLCLGSPIPSTGTLRDFSPPFVRAAIELFTKPGDVVLDPYLGGGTALVEALALGRRGVGADISSLATFVTQVKTTLLSHQELLLIRSWGSERQGIHQYSRTVAEVERLDGGVLSKASANEIDMAS